MFRAHNPYRLADRCQALQIIHVAVLAQTKTREWNASEQVMLSIENEFIVTKQVVLSSSSNVLSNYREKKLKYTEMHAISAIHDRDKSLGQQGEKMAGLQ